MSCLVCCNKEAFDNYLVLYCLAKQYLHYDFDPGEDCIVDISYRHKCKDMDSLISYMYDKFTQDGRQEALIVVSYGCTYPMAGPHILSTNLIPTRPGYGINVVDIVRRNICTRFERRPINPDIDYGVNTKVDIYIHISNEPPNSGAKVMWFYDEYKNKDSTAYHIIPTLIYGDVDNAIHTDPLVDFSTCHGNLIDEQNCDFRPKTITDEKMRPILDMIEEYRTSRVKDLYRFNKLNGSMFVHF